MNKESETAQELFGCMECNTNPAAGVPYDSTLVEDYSICATCLARNYLLSSSNTLFVPRHEMTNVMRQQRQKWLDVETVQQAQNRVDGGYNGPIVWFDLDWEPPSECQKVAEFVNRHEQFRVLWVRVQEEDTVEKVSRLCTGLVSNTKLVHVDIQMGYLADDDTWEGKRESFLCILELLIQNCTNLRVLELQFSDAARKSELERRLRQAAQTKKDLKLRVGFGYC